MVLLPRQHLAPVPLLPTRGPAWGPFASRGAHRTPAPAVVSAACAALLLFLVACALAAPERLEGPVPAGGGSGGARRLTQFLAPVWYALPTLFDSIYNLGEAWADYRLLPEEYRVAAELNAYVEDAGLGAEAPTSAPASVEPEPAPASYDAAFADYASIPSRAGVALE